MVRVEQAIFTATAEDPDNGCRLAAASAGVDEAERRELAAWGPSPDALIGPDSLNFHPLPSGRYCVSHTRGDGPACGRGGMSPRTHCLVVEEAALGRFGYNPFALYRAAAAAAAELPAELPTELPPLEVSGRAASVDQPLLAQLAGLPGARWMAAAVQTAIDSPCLILVGVGAESIIAGLLNCLPPECRAEFSFATGLRFSPRRPFRLLGHPAGVDRLRPLARRYNMAVVDTAGPPPSAGPLDGWARLIERSLAVGRTSLLALEFSKRRFDLTVDDLPALGLQLLEGLDGSALRGEPVEQPAAARTIQQAHAPHRPPPAARPAGPSSTLDPQSPAVLEKLEALDDAVFEAVGGKPEALELLRRLWPATRAALGDALLAESREQYLRYALSIWEECTGAAGVRNPAKAASALDALCVLFDEV